MNRFVAFATAAVVVVSASEAQAQERVSSRFDLGAYGGYSWTSPWFSYGDADYGVGGAPSFGVTGTLWASETFGIRAHGGYIPSSAPTDEGTPAAMAELDYPVNNWLADLGVAFRPMSSSDSEFLSSMFFWLGGGMLRTNVAGDPVPLAGDEVRCVDEYAPLATCLSYQPDYATVGQGTLGLGFDIIPLSRRLGLFGELGAHVYDSPTHSFGDAEDRFAVTGRAVAGLKLALGAISAPVVPIPPPPPPPPPPAERTIQVCVVRNGAVQNISATFAPATNDTTVNGIPFAQAHPATAPNYAAGVNWFIQSSDMSFADREWVKYGVSRVVQPTQLQPAGEFQGTPVFAEAGATAPFEIVYIPVRPGCEFQPYTPREIIRPRG